jgi:cytochrome P450
MRMFTLAALSYPDLVTRAQKELDSVVGPDRLPTLDDVPNLPYISAIVTESLRWRSIVPGGVPHATLAADKYMGYRIPKGATIVWLCWAMALDENTFDRPLEFVPERWLENPEHSKDRFVNFFGYGRRLCTGRHIARNSLFLLIARILWGFNIRHAVDEDGRPKEVDDLDMTSGFVSSPVPFEAVFEPRSMHHKKVIEDNWHDAEKDVDVIMNSIRDNQLSIDLKVRA